MIPTLSSYGQELIFQEENLTSKGNTVERNQKKEFVMDTTLDKLQPKKHKIFFIKV